MDLKEKRKLIMFSTLFGLIITLVSSLLINSYVIGEFPNIVFVSIPILGVRYFGYPLPWLKEIVYPGSPKNFIYVHLFIDFLFWTGFVALLKLAKMDLSEPKKKISKKTTRKDAPVTDINGIGKKTAEKLAKSRIKTVRGLLSLNPETLAEKIDVSVETAKKYQKRAKKISK